MIIIKKWRNFYTPVLKTVFGKVYHTSRRVKVKYDIQRRTNHSIHCAIFRFVITTWPPWLPYLFDLMLLLNKSHPRLNAADGSKIINKFRAQISAAPNYKNAASTSRIMRKNSVQPGNLHHPVNYNSSSAKKQRHWNL